MPLAHTLCFFFSFFSSFFVCFFTLVHSFRFCGDQPIINDERFIDYNVPERVNAFLDQINYQVGGSFLLFHFMFTRTRVD